MTIPKDKSIVSAARILFETNPGRNRALKWEHAATPRGRYLKHAAALKAAGFEILSEQELRDRIEAAYKRGYYTGGNGA